MPEPVMPEPVASEPEPGVDGWVVLPGTVTTRSEVAQVYGGATQGGIQPSARTPNVMIYSDPASGAQHGYTFDGFSSDGAYYYTGEGQRGDQQLRAGNRAIAEHAEQGKVLRVFEAAGGKTPGGKPQRYLGAFTVDPQEPFRTQTAPDSDGLMRKVLVVFRLLPTEAVTGTATATAPAIPAASSAVEVACEANVVDTFEISIPAQTKEGRRWEAQVMSSLEEHLASQGHRVKRLMITAPGETRAMPTDTFDATTGELFEIKPSASRTHIREAVAQLLDYRRHAPQAKTCTVLVPVRPSDDLIDLVNSTGLKLAHFTGDNITYLTSPHTRTAQNIQTMTTQPRQTHNQNQQSQGQQGRAQQGQGLGVRPAPRPDPRPGLSR